jgi:hypothetical protein
LNLDDEFGFAQGIGELLVLKLELAYSFLLRVAFGFGTAVRSSS